MEPFELDILDILINSNKTVNADILSGLKDYSSISCYECIIKHQYWDWTDAYARTLRKLWYLVYENGEFVPKFAQQGCIGRNCEKCVYKNFSE